MGCGLHENSKCNMIEETIALFIIKLLLPSIDFYSGIEI